MSKFYSFYVSGLVFAAMVSPAICSAGEEPCVTNFTQQGGFMTGKTYKTWQDLTTVSKADAYTRIYTALVKDGWKIASSDKEVGAISAAQEVTLGSGKSAPFSVIVEALETGSKVSLAFSTSGAVAAKAKSVQASMCSYLAAASK